MKKSRTYIISQANCPHVSFHKKIVYAQGTGPRHPHSVAKSTTPTIEVDRCSYRMVKKCALRLKEKSETMIKSRSGQVYVVVYHDHKSDIKR